MTRTWVGRVRGVAAARGAGSAGVGESGLAPHQNGLAAPCDLKEIVLICHVFPPEPAPGGIMVAELAEHLASRGYRTTVITGWPNHPAGVLYQGWRRGWRQVEREPRGFQVIRCNHSIHPRNGTIWRLWYYLSFAVSAASCLLSIRRLDVVLSLSTPIFGSFAAWFVSRLRNARFVYAVFDLHPEAAANAGQMRRGAAYRLLRRVDSALCRRSDEILTLSEGIRSQILARGIDPEKVSVAPLWLDGERIRPTDRDNAWRRENGVGVDTFVALFAGTVGYASGAEFLVEVASLLKERTDILILCVGEGPVKEKMMAAAARRDVGNLRFLPFQPESRLAEMQAAADVGLVTLLPDSGQTSMPSKVIAYLAAGRPVIAAVAAESDTAKLLELGGCGLVVPCQEARSLANAIECLADNEARRAEMGSRARAHFEKEFEKAVGVARYERLLLRSNRAEAGSEDRRPG